MGPLQSAIRYYYAEVGAQQAAQTANEDFAERNVEMLQVEESESGDPEAPIVKLLNSLLDRAISTGASDVHIEPFEGSTRVRMRIDGTIVDYVTLQRSVHQPLIARIKIMANLDIAERRLPQDGHFRIRVRQSEYVNIRVSLLPTVFGEKAVLRILATAGQVDHASHFGMDDESYARFLPMLNSPNGIIYITGPTGSGKSTTLYMALEYLSHRQVNISTVEDPVEKNVPSINQTQVNPVAGLTFESGLRALLRQDPDIIMVGETRDGETAGIFGSCRHHRSPGAEYTAYQRCGLEYRPSGRYGHRPLSDRKFAGRSGRAATDAQGVSALWQRGRSYAAGAGAARQGYHDHQARHRLYALQRHRLPRPYCCA